MQELIRTWQNWKNKKEAIDQDIANGESLRLNWTEKYNTFGQELEQINDSLVQKQSVLGVYEKIIEESDSAYSKIVRSTEALYQMVKTEEQKVNTSPSVGNTMKKYK